MAEPVTAAELAEALRELRLAVTTCVLTADWPMPELRGPLEAARSLLARYDAQQAEASKRKTAKQLVPTCSCPIADTGDFDECCIVCGESTDGGHSPDRCIENIGAGIRQELEFEREQPEPINPALSEVEQAAKYVAKAWSEGESSLPGAMFMLCEALRKRGAM